MTDPKAPLPDDAQAALADLVPVAKYWKADHRLVAVLQAHEETLRAHIASQDATIAAQAEKIAELEAENKRLREALIKWEDCYANNGRTTSIHDWDLLLREARRTGKAALAQTAEPAKVCETCDGGGLVYDKIGVIGAGHVECKACNGTGRV